MRVLTNLPKRKSMPGTSHGSSFTTVQVDQAHTRALQAFLGICDLPPSILIRMPVALKGA